MTSPLSQASFSWLMPVQVRFAEGCAQEVPTALEDHPAVVMSFSGTTATRLRATWSRALKQQLLAWIEVPDGLSSLGRGRALSAAIWPLLHRHPDAVLIAVGGGTTLDLAKVVRCRPVAASGARDFDPIAAALRSQAPWPALALAPLWLVPTTAGTGSEVTRWATVWDTEADTPIKRSLDEPFGYADRAFVDPDLTRTCPAAVVRDTGLDTLAHALESLWNRHSNPVSSALAISAARRVITCLPQRLSHPAQAASRRGMSLAALEAGLAFSQTRTALAHALSYALTLERGIPHGAACAAWLPAVWRLAVHRDLAVDAALADLTAVLLRQEDRAVLPKRRLRASDTPTGPDDTDLGERAREGAEALTRWLRRLGACADPAEWGIQDANERLQAALTSQRGRNFLSAADSQAAS